MKIFKMLKNLMDHVGNLWSDGVTCRGRSSDRCDENRKHIYGENVRALGWVKANMRTIHEVCRSNSELFGKSYLQ